MENFKKYVRKYNIENPFSVDTIGFDEDREYQVELDMFKFTTEYEAKMVAELFNVMFASMVGEEKETTDISNCTLCDVSLVEQSGTEVCDHKFKLIKADGAFSYRKCTKCRKIG